jgi:adenylate cyclase
MLRKLTVILSADVVGFSGLMERDETGTMTRLMANRQSVFEPRVAAHGGRIFKLMGDGALVEFTSVVAAVDCAREIQEATDAATEWAEHERIRYRVGINLGEVLVEGDDIYGDGVNVATRLQALATPGGVAISRNVREQVEGRVAADFEDLGEHTIKNIERPVHVFALRGASLAAPSAPTATPRPHTPTICVLPFANMSGEPEQEFFSDGITEDIITDLSKVSALSVVSRNTSFTFKAKQIDIAQVASQLKVSHVVEGSVRKAGNRVRITAQLIEGASDNHLWAERYDRDLNDIFALQDEISSAIVKALKVRLLPEEKNAMARRATSSAEAYQLYLLARKYTTTGTQRHYPVSIRLCQRAVEIDPKYARAWAMLAICQSHNSLVGAKADEDGWAAAERALSLEPNLAEAHAAKGRILGNEGRFEEALVEHRTALRIAPKAYEVNAAAARSLIATRRWDEAIACLERAAWDIEADFWALENSIQCHQAKGDTAGAISAARRALERVEKVIAAESDHGVAMGYGIRALVMLGETDRAKEWMKRALLLDPENMLLHYKIACSMIQLGDMDAAIKYLDPVGKIMRRPSLIWWEIDPELDLIRNDSRFQALMANATARIAASG